VTTVEDHDWIVKMIVLFLGGLSFFMILRTTITLSSRRKCHPLSALTEIVILPLFVEALMIIWVATSAIAIASIPTAGKSKQHEQ
jgi:Trk-type K+ transport system membrane component